MKLEAPFAGLAILLDLGVGQLDYQSKGVLDELASVGACGDAWDLGALVDGLEVVI